jgi:hypothetical protein
VVGIHRLTPLWLLGAALVVSALHRRIKMPHQVVLVVAAETNQQE